MELKSVLNKPCSDIDKINFYSINNDRHHYEIRETEAAYEAWGDTGAESLAKAKQMKYNSANYKANEFLESGEAVFEFEEGKHIEATDGNIGKFTGYGLAYVTGKLQPTDTVLWNTKEDESVELSREQVDQILTGLGAVQASVWVNQFPAYVKAIDEATTESEVNAITIEYYSEAPVGEE